MGSQPKDRVAHQMIHSYTAPEQCSCRFEERLDCRPNPIGCTVFIVFLILSTQGAMTGAVASTVKAADEGSFLELLIASERVDRWLDCIKDQAAEAGR